MHPPFYIVDHRIGPDIHHQSDDRPVVRRSLPERLALKPSGALTDNGALHMPSGATLPPQATLHVVPPPQRKLRDVIGRFLIRAGQRMIMENRV